MIKAVGGGEAVAAFPFSYPYLFRVFVLAQCFHQPVEVLQGDQVSYADGVDVGGLSCALGFPNYPGLSGLPGGSPVPLGLLGFSV